MNFLGENIQRVEKQNVIPRWSGAKRRCSNRCCRNKRGFIIYNFKLLKKQTKTIQFYLLTRIFVTLYNDSVHDVMRLPTFKAGYVLFLIIKWINMLQY